MAGGLSPDGPGVSQVRVLLSGNCPEVTSNIWWPDQQRGRVRRCQLINLIRTSLEGRTQTAKTRPILSDQGCQWWYKSLKRYFWKDIFGWSMPINGMTGSLFVKVFWSAECPRVRAVYLNLPFSWHASSVTKPVTRLVSHSPGVYDFLSFQFSLIASLCRDRETGGVWGRGLKVTPV